MRSIAPHACTLRLGRRQKAMDWRWAAAALPSPLLLLLLLVHPAAAADCLALVGGGAPGSGCQQASDGQLLQATMPFSHPVQWAKQEQQQPQGNPAAELSVQRLAASHGVWVSQQTLRDLNGGELHLDDSGSIEQVLATLGFAYSSWGQPPPAGAATTPQHYSAYVASFVAWVKQNLAAGRMPISGARAPSAAPQPKAGQPNATASQAAGQQQPASVGLSSIRPPVRSRGVEVEGGVRSSHRGSSSVTRRLRPPGVLQAASPAAAQSGLGAARNNSSDVQRSSNSSASHAVAMGGLQQGALGARAVMVTPLDRFWAAAAVPPPEPDAAGAAVPANGTQLFKPLKLEVTVWSSAPGAAASAEPPPSLQATAYALDVSRCAARGEVFTVLRFNGLLAFRSNGQVTDQGRAVLSNPASAADLRARCNASKAACMAVHVVRDDRQQQLGAADLGPFPAGGVTYHVCVAGRV